MRNDGIRKRQGGGGWMIGRRDSLAGLLVKMERLQQQCGRDEIQYSTVQYVRVGETETKFGEARSDLTRPDRGLLATGYGRLGQNQQWRSRKG